MTTVYVPQIPRKRDPATNNFLPTVNISPASVFGEVVVLMPPQVSFHATQDIIDLVKPQVDKYSFEDGDSIVSIGDPSIMAVVIGLIAKRHGRFYLLKWDRMVQQYIKVKVVL